MENVPREALQELFELFIKYPELLSQIRFTVRPDKILQGTDEPKK